MKRRLRVGVLFGGRSGEHHVSLRSAASVMSVMDKERYQVIPIGITQNGRWISGGDPMRVLMSDGRGETAALLSDPNQKALLKLERETDQEMSFQRGEQLDVIFPVLHGTYGEDGTVQGLLELAGIPYVGAGVVGSALAMDKVVFKKVMIAEGLPVLPYELIVRSKWEQNKDPILDRIESSLAYPIFTKPANLGSSVGINKCDNRDELKRGIDVAAQFDRRLVAEQGIDAREIECSVLGNDEPIASIAGEIVPSREFYDYQAKYLDDKEDASELLIPAPITDAQMLLVRQLSVAAFKAIDGAGLGRVDFLMHKTTGEIYINEINTIPGFTSISMYPKLWEATGLPYPELIDRLIELALERSVEKSQLITHFSEDTA
ncbi:MAG: D-alanine--D-alanine ligase family protein [Chloroflexota bacterium]